MNYKKKNLLSFKVEDCLLNISKKVKHQFFLNEEDFRYIKTRHSFHLVDPSPWPLTSALGAFMLTTGGVLYMHKFIGGDRLLLTGLFVILYSMYTWWRDVIREATFEDQHTLAVQRGLRLGMILFIVSEVMFFFAFFWAFFHSSLAPVFNIGGVWPPEDISPIQTSGIPLTNTFLLLSSGATVTWAHHAIIVRAKRQAIIGLIFTLILAILFTSLQGLEYVEAPFCISDSVFGSCFYMATGFHGFHVFIGTVSLFVSLWRIVINHFTPTHHFGFESAAWYWHFVDVVWLFLFITVYWWGGYTTELVPVTDLEGSSRFSVIKWAFRQMIYPDLIIFQIFVFVDGIVHFAAYFLFSCFVIMNIQANLFCKKLVRFASNLTFTESVLLYMFTVTFAIPNKIWINHKLNSYITGFFIFMIFFLSGFFPILTFFVVVYSFLIIESYAVAFFYTQKNQKFKNYIVKNLFGGDTTMADAYFAFFWGNMKKGAEIAGRSGVAGYIGRTVWNAITENEEHQADKAAERETEFAVKNANKPVAPKEVDELREEAKQRHMDKNATYTNIEKSAKGYAKSLWDKKDD